MAQAVVDPTVADNPSQVMEATESFCTEISGQTVMVNAGTTRVTASHELVKRFPDWFKQIELSYRAEDASSEPGQRRQRERTAGKTEERIVKGSTDA